MLGAQNGYRPSPQPPTGQRQQQQHQAPYQGQPQQRPSPAPFAGFKLAGAAPPQQEQQQFNRRPGPRKWTVAQLRASDAIIPLQSGTNQFASQSGMTGFGTPRNTTTNVYGGNIEPVEPEPLRPADTVIPLQYGTNQYASQRGMTGFGQPRDVTGKHLHRLYEDDPDSVPDQGEWRQ